METPKGRNNKNRAPTPPSEAPLLVLRRRDDISPNPLPEIPSSLWVLLIFLVGGGGKEEIDWEEEEEGEEEEAPQAISLLLLFRLYGMCICVRH